MGFETEMGYDWVINLGDGTGSKFLTAAHLSIFICELKQRLMIFLLSNAFKFLIFSFLYDVFESGLHDYCLF